MVMEQQLEERSTEKIIDQHAILFLNKQFRDHLHLKSNISLELMKFSPKI